MLLVYKQTRDEVLPITRAWITDQNEIYGMTALGNEVLLAGYDDDGQAQQALDQLFDLIPGPKYEMPENFTDEYSYNLVEKCKEVLSRFSQKEKDRQ
ncbi:hypothetical protein [Dehalobacter sp.]|uniref:hypothetical protein n=1 Tax=Dehalobacter sp. TaxID=1962289 RepID=UPI002583A485|nr:hypothetical protein [Dehalobacter sp.]MDJ0305363.1 hypothetical protein [Dehalobacter sp.]